MSEWRLDGVVEPFDESSSKDYIWQKLDLTKSVVEIKAAMGLKTLSLQRTTAFTHPNGVMLHGFADVTAKVPTAVNKKHSGIAILARQEFFKHGKRYPIMARFSNFGSCTDDRELAIRAAALKFSDHPVSSQD